MKSVSIIKCIIGAPTSIGQNEQTASSTRLQPFRNKKGKLMKSRKSSRRRYNYAKGANRNYSHKPARKTNKIKKITPSTFPQSLTPRKKIVRTYNLLRKSIIQTYRVCKPILTSTIKLFNQLPKPIQIVIELWLLVLLIDHTRILDIIKLLLLLEIGPGYV